MENLTVVDLSNNQGFVSTVTAKSELFSSTSYPVISIHYEINMILVSNFRKPNIGKREILSIQGLEFRFVHTNTGWYIQNLCSYLPDV
jgi:hypothetical protein